MKLFFVVVLLLALLGLQPARADNALGVVLGDPTGISGRFSVSPANSFEMAVAYSSSHYEGLHIHGTYLWDNARNFRTSASPLEMYYGLGVRLITINKGERDGSTAVGPRAPIGLLYKINNPNLEFFGEVSATVDITPKTDVDLDIGIGVRVRF